MLLQAVHERLDNTPNVNMNWKDLPPIVLSILKATAGKKDESGRCALKERYTCTQQRAQRTRAAGLYSKQGKNVEGDRCVLERQVCLYSANSKPGKIVRAAAAVQKKQGNLS